MFRNASTNEIDKALSAHYRHARQLLAEDADDKDRDDDKHDDDKDGDSGCHWPRLGTVGRVNKVAVVGTPDGHHRVEVDPGGSGVWHYFRPIGAGERGELSRFIPSRHPDPASIPFREHSMMTPDGAVVAPGKDLTHLAREFVAAQNTTDGDELLFRADREALNTTSTWNKPVSDFYRHAFCARVAQLIPKPTRAAAAPVTHVADFPDVLMNIE